jgi:hypothetical protein
VAIESAASAVCGALRTEFPDVDASAILLSVAQARYGVNLFGLGWSQGDAMVQTIARNNLLLRTGVLAETAR